MRADQQIPSQQHTDSIASDPEYIQFLEREDAATREAIDNDVHTGCTIYNDFGMCGACDALYQRGYTIGLQDHANGIALTDGERVWYALNDGAPLWCGGALSGYAHGWSRAALRAVVTRALAVA